MKDGAFFFLVDLKRIMIVLEINFHIISTLAISCLFGTYEILGAYIISYILFFEILTKKKFVLKFPSIFYKRVNPTNVSTAPPIQIFKF